MATALLHRQFSEQLFRFRHLLVLLTFIALVLGEFHGSSISCWSEMLQPGANPSRYSSPVLGVPRPIRGDEYAVHTPMALSQEYTGYAVENDLWRAAPTNMGTVYNQPVKDLSSLAKPFHWGYLLFGSSHGLSWFWCGRLLALLLVSFELFLLISGQNRAVALAGACLVAFSPLVQWWFAVNGLVETLVFGPLAILTARRFLRSGNPWLKTALACLFGVCGAAYILSFYPAWQIPFFYVFLALLGWVIVANWKAAPRRARELAYVVLALLVTAALVLPLLAQSWEAISLARNTEYPGARFNTGGGGLDRLFYYLLPYKLFHITNECELGAFTSLFPLPALMAFYFMLRGKKKDVLLISLLAVQLFLFFYLSTGFPDILAKYSLMFASASFRAFVVLGYIDIFILAYLVGRMPKDMGKFALWGIPSAFAALTGYAVYAAIQKEIPLGMASPFTLYLFLALLVCALFALSRFLIADLSGKKLQALAMLAALAAVLSCGLINPVMRGLDAVMQLPVAKEIAAIQKKAPGRWLVVGGYPKGNLPPMLGAPGINSTNIYPNLELWRRLDPDRKFSHEYNRYAHYAVSLHDGDESTFHLLGLDYVELRLAVADLQKIQAYYVLTTSPEPEPAIAGNAMFSKIYDEAGIRIYAVSYPAAGAGG